MITKPIVSKVDVWC